MRDRVSASRPAIIITTCFNWNTVIKIIHISAADEEKYAVRSGHLVLDEGNNRYTGSVGDYYSRNTSETNAISIYLLAFNWFWNYPNYNETESRYGGISLRCLAIEQSREDKKPKHEE